MVRHHRSMPRQSHDGVCRGPLSILVGHSLENGTSHLSGSANPSASIPHSPTTTPGVDHSNPVWHGSLRNGVSATSRHGEGGHDLQEDKTPAPASICFDAESNMVRDSASSGPTESVFERMARACGMDGRGAVGTAVVGHGHPGVMHGFKATAAICRLRGARRPDPSGALVGGLGLIFFFFGQG